MSLIGRGHSAVVHRRRTRTLAAALASLAPERGSLLDIGAGDGLLASALAEARPALEVRGVDVLVRSSTHIPVEPFDGHVLPYADRSFDASMLVDVLHHCDDPIEVLAEAVRVARSTILVKDHLSDARFAVARLRLMDAVGNRRHGVALPGNYRPSAWWTDAFQRLGVAPTVWQTRLHLYVPGADWIFGGSLHFLARLERIDAAR